jgi:hypothetical protein
MICISYQPAICGGARMARQKLRLLEQIAVDKKNNLPEVLT